MNVPMSLLKKESILGTGHSGEVKVPVEVVKRDIDKMLIQFITGHNSLMRHSNI